MQKFQLKFIDVMVGVVLGLGFGWWPGLKEPWQFVAFVFAYLNLIDYWVDYNPTVKKYSMKLEVDVILHTLIIFGMFLLIFATQKTAVYFLIAFAFYRIVDVFWLWRIKREHKIPTGDLTFINTWFFYDIVEAASALIVAFIAARELLSPLPALLVFVIIRIATRITSSARYKKIFFAV